jgi:hypothetical protein
MSARVRHRSRTASSSELGMRIATNSPARCNRASRRQSRRSVSGLVAGGLGDQRRSDHLAAHVHAGRQPGQLEAARAGLVAGSQPRPIGEPRHEPADRRLIVGDPLDVGDLLVRIQDPDRDGGLVDVQAKMDSGKVRDTGHGRLLPYGGSARTSVGDPRHMRTGAGRSILTITIRWHFITYGGCGVSEASMPLVERLGPRPAGDILEPCFGLARRS